MLGTPRTDPGGRDSRTGLPPLVFDGEAFIGLQRRIIDRKQTESFRAFCRHYSTYGPIKTLAGFDLTRKSDLASTYIASLTDRSSQAEALQFLSAWQRRLGA